MACFETKNVLKFPQKRGDLTPNQGRVCNNTKDRAPTEFWPLFIVEDVIQFCKQNGNLRSVTALQEAASVLERELGSRNGS